MVIAHRPSILRHVDKILVLSPEGPVAFGPRDKILRTVTGPAPKHTPAVRNNEDDHEQLEIA